MTASPAPSRRTPAISLAAFLVAVAGIAYLASTHQLFAHGPLWIGLQVLAALLMVWARVTFGRRSFHAAANPTAGGLVTWGPYRYWRHPIYAAIVYFVAVGVFCNSSPGSVVAGLVITAALFARMLLEERLLVGVYPEYRDYAARTKRLIPFVI